MTIERPLDLLHQSKGLNVIVNCKDGKVFTGKLLAFDIHINLALEGMKEIDRTGSAIERFGLSFIRGDTINFISPGEK